MAFCDAPAWLADSSALVPACASRSISSCASSLGSVSGAPDRVSRGLGLGRLRLLQSGGGGGELGCELHGLLVVGLDSGLQVGYRALQRALHLFARVALLCKFAPCTQRPDSNVLELVSKRLLALLQRLDLARSIVERSLQAHQICGVLVALRLLCSLGCGKDGLTLGAL